MRLNFYAQNRNLVIVNGVQLPGPGDGDWIEIDLEGNEASRVHGGDGPSMSISTAQGGKITIGLLPTSPALPTMYALRDAQQTNPSLFNVQVVSGVDEVILATGCGFGKLPAFQSGGPQMRSRQFAFECMEIQMDLSAVEALNGGMLGGNAAQF